MTEHLHERRETGFTIINPPELGKPRGFAHGVVTPAGGRTLRIAGQTAVDAHGQVTGHEFAEQFEIALARVLVVVRAAAGAPEHIARMMIYVTDMTAYRRSRSQLSDVWRRQMGTHYPAMVLVQVVALVDEHAMVEIEAEAVIP